MEISKSSKENEPQANYNKKTYSIEENTAPRLALACEKMREFDGKNDGFLEGFLGLVETSDVIPLDVGRFGEDGTTQRALKALLFLIFIIIVVVALASATRISDRRGTEAERTRARRWQRRSAWALRGRWP